MLKGKNTMNDKPKQTIEKRLFWSDFSVNTVLDTLYSTLYDSTLFVKINDGFSYVMKNSKTKFPKGINGCVSQKYIDVHSFSPQKIITENSLYGFTSNFILDNDSTDEKWLFVIFVKKDVYDSFFKISYSANEPSDSLPHKVIDCLIQNVTNFIFNWQLDEAHIAIENNAADVIRHAGSTVLNTVAMCKLNNISYTSLSEVINKISYLPYEKKIIGNNGILFAKRTRPDALQLIIKQVEKTMSLLGKINSEPNLSTIDEANTVIEECDNLQAIGTGTYILPGKDINVDYILSYKEPIPINNSRHIRKLLETTNDDTFLISDSVFGLGKIKKSSKDNYYVKFYGYGKWAFFLDKNCIMEYENGIPHLPRSEFDAADFKNRFFECFGQNKESESNSENYSNIIKSAVQEHTGAIIVISNNAEKESQRLSKQSTLIEKEKLDENNIKSLIKIDGAVLADQELNCFSFGVILDGLSSSAIGTPARGSRYNSSYRYWHTRNAKDDKLLVVVISDDGRVDVIHKAGEKDDSWVRCDVCNVPNETNES